MKTVSVSKLRLLEKLKENAASHQAEFEKLNREYQGVMIENLARILQRFERERQEGAPSHPPSLHSISAPRSYTKHYQRAIGMLELHQSELVDLSEQEYDRYWLDEWGWRQEFDMVRTSYNNNADARE